MSGANTIREGSASTVHENGAAVKNQDTILEGGGFSASPVAGDSIDGLQVRRQLPTAGSEADVYIVLEKGEERVLKLYRYGLEPKQKILDRYKAISTEFPEHVVRVYNMGRDGRTGRWYELLEFVRYGSVADWLQQKGHFEFQTFVKELGGAVNALHERGIIHRDLKPGNILVRSPAPLDLVLTDFGIASVLEGDMSLRETSHAGFTPMYAAPEDMDGRIVSAPADWWACGMIFLEILTGVHPFKGLSPKRIAYFLSTRGVEIDPKLPERQRRLLKGLLTRNDKKRWGWRQIKAWLAGDDSPPVHYEEPGLEGGAAPFRFLGESYASPRQMALSFASGFEAWKAGRGTLARGNIAKWLRDKHEFDEERIVSEDLADNDADIYLARFIAHYAPELPPNIYGLELSAANLLALLAKPETERAENERAAIAFVLGKGALAALLQSYANSPQSGDKVLQAIACRRWRGPDELRKNLFVLLAPEGFYWGPLGAPENLEKRMAFVKNNPDILTWQSWEAMEGPELLLPPSVEQLFGQGKYAEAIAELASRKRSNSLLYKRDLPKGGTVADESAYARLLGEKHGLNGRVLDLLGKTRGLVEKIEARSDPMELKLDREARMVGDYCSAILAGRKIWRAQDYEPLRRIYDNLAKLATSSQDLHKKFFTNPFTILACIAAILFSYFLSLGLGQAVSDWLTSSSFEGAAMWVAVAGAVIGGLAAQLAGAVIGFLFFGFLMYLLQLSAPAMPYIFIVSAVVLLIVFGRLWSRRKLASIRAEKPELLNEVRSLLLRLYDEPENSQNQQTNKSQNRQPSRAVKQGGGRGRWGV